MVYNYQDETTLSELVTRFSLVIWKNIQAKDSIDLQFILLEHLS